VNTEERAVRYRGLDTWPDEEILQALLERQFMALAAVNASLPAIERAATLAASRLREGSGRLVYAGAGTSGRLAVLDAVELVPTFGWPQERIVYLLAGGEQALVRSAESAEDEAQEGASLVERAAVGPADVVVGVAASGTTRFTVSAVEESRRRGALTVGVANNRSTPLLQRAEVPVLLESGPEVIAGSTRLAAGTAQKVALNLFSTLLMIRLGRVYSNLMVGVQTSNDKLVKRGVAMVSEIAGVPHEEARRALRRAQGDVRLAVLLCKGYDLNRARSLLSENGGNLREVIG